MSQPASGVWEQLLGVAQALSPFKVRAPPTPFRPASPNARRVFAEAPPLPQQPLDALA